MLYLFGKQILKLIFFFLFYPWIHINVQSLILNCRLVVEKCYLYHYLYSQFFKKLIKYEWSRR